MGRLSNWRKKAENLRAKAKEQVPKMTKRIARKMTDSKLRKMITIATDELERRED